MIFWEFVKEHWELMVGPGQSIGDRIIGAILTGITALLAFLVLGGVFWFVDSSFRTKQKADGVVVGRSYSPAWVQYQTTYVGSTPIMTPIHHSETFYLSILINEKTVSTSVTPQVFHWQDGTEVECEYHTGRLSGGIYIDRMMKK